MKQMCDTNTYHMHKSYNLDVYIYASPCSLMQDGWRGMD